MASLAASDWSLLIRRGVSVNMMDASEKYFGIKGEGVAKLF